MFNNTYKEIQDNYSKLSKDLENTIMLSTRLSDYLTHPELLYIDISANNYQKLYNQYLAEDHIVYQKQLKIQWIILLKIFLKF